MASSLSQHRSPHRSRRPPRGGTVVGGGGGGWLLVLVDRVEQVVDLPRGSRGEQPVDLLGVAEHHRDLAQDLQMPVVHPRDPDREPDLVAVPVDRPLIPHHRQRGPRDRVLRLVRAMGNPQIVPHVRPHRPLPLDHRLHIPRTHRPRLHQNPPRLPDRLLLTARRTRDLDLRQRQNLTHPAPLILHHSSAQAPSPKFVKHVKFGGQLLAVLSWALVTLSPSTIASYFGLFMKLSTDTCS